MKLIKKKKDFMFMVQFLQIPVSFVLSVLDPSLKDLSSWLQLCRWEDLPSAQGSNSSKNG